MTLHGEFPIDQHEALENIEKGTLLISFPIASSDKVSTERIDLFPAPLLPMDGYGTDTRFRSSTHDGATRERYF